MYMSRLIEYVENEHVSERDGYEMPYFVQPLICSTKRRAYYAGERIHNLSS